MWAAGRYFEGRFFTAKYSTIDPATRLPSLSLIPVIPHCKLLLVRVLEVGRGSGYRNSEIFLRTVFSQLNGVKTPKFFLGDLYLAETAKTDQATEVAEKRQLLALGLKVESKSSEIY